MKAENYQLCPNCQTGFDSLKLDNRTPMCPYLAFHNGTHCEKFLEMKKLSAKIE